MTKFQATIHSLKVDKKGESTIVLKVSREDMAPVVGLLHGLEKLIMVQIDLSEIK